MTTTTIAGPIRLFANLAELTGQPTTGELVQQVLEGSQQGWARLILRYTPLVRSVTRRYGLNESDADDVRQNVWMRLHEHIGDLREPRALPAWIRTIAHNDVMRILKAGFRTVPVGAAAPCLDEGFVPEFDRDVHRREVGQAVRSVLERLSPNQRRLMECFLADPDISYSDLSRLLGIPLGSVGPTRARCLKKLREAVEIRALAS